MHIDLQYKSLNRKQNLADLGVDEKIMLKQNLNKEVLGMWTGFIIMGCYGWVLMSEHDNYSAKVVGFVDSVTYAVWNY